MKMSAKYLYSAAALTAFLQTGLLFASIEQRAQVLRNGQDVVLQTSRVDPRDLLRGDYVILGYDFSNVQSTAIEGAQDGYSGEVYIALKQGNDGLWHMSRASVQAFNDLSAGEVQIRGQTDYALLPSGQSSASLRFGIERYYVPEGEGLAIEGELSDKNITAVVSLSKSGTPQIKALLNKGVTIFEEPLY